MPTLSKVQIESQRLRSCLCRHLRKLDRPRHVHTTRSDIVFEQSKAERNGAKSCDQLLGGFTSVQTKRRLPPNRKRRTPLSCLPYVETTTEARAAQDKRERGPQTSHTDRLFVSPVALFPPVSLVSLESGIGHCSRSGHEYCGLRHHQRKKFFQRPDHNSARRLNAPCPIQ